jgi:hypothetical protein
MSETQRPDRPSGEPDIDVAGIIAGLRERRPDPADAPAVSGWMLPTLGVLHAPVYRSRELRRRFADVGVTEAMAAYLAQRSAPLGAASPQLVTATFYGFSPTAVATHVPAVWERVAPAEVLALTLEVMRELLGRLIGDRTDVVDELAALLGPVADAHPIVGRPLAAAWASVGRTGDPVLDVWLATCVIRESRGDGHIALLVAEDIGPLESHLVTQGDDPARRPALQALRGWTTEELDGAAERLRGRGLLDADGGRTDAAREIRRRIERRTDELSAAPWVEAGPATVTRIGDLALELLPPVLTSGTLLPPVIERLKRRD